jgi:hypothetical protein
MNSERSHNITLTAGAHFYLAYVGSAWVALNDPSQSGLQWSIVTFIDLRMRPDGFINTPPTASVASPQYAIVNRTIQINIPVSDVNAGDDVRCRWSTYTAGYRRRKRSIAEEHNDQQDTVYMYKKQTEDRQIIHIMKKRDNNNNNNNNGGSCSSGCCKGDDCTDSSCVGTTCTGNKCKDDPCCDVVSTTTTTTALISTTVTTALLSSTPANTTTVSLTTIETPGILKSTSSYPHRQAIDECGGICFPNSTPNGTTLSNCTISFTGLKANTWYAVAVQVTRQ